MTTSNYEKLNCPIARSLSVLGDQWTFLIVRDALSGTTRFSDFLEGLGLSRNLLSQRLLHLCEHGLLVRSPIPGSKRFEYVPTEKCHELRPVILSLAALGARWFEGEQLTQVECIDQRTGHPVEVGFIDIETGRQVASMDVKAERRNRRSSKGG